MIDWFLNLDFVMQAFVSTLFTWFITLLGAMVVFFFKNVNKTFMDSMLGFSAGIMLAASFFSLLSPAIDMSNKLNLSPAFVCAIGIILGTILLFVGDKAFKVIDKKKKNKTTNNLKRCLILVVSITLHNIPEGLAVGVAFGSLYYGLDHTSITSACMLALGIGLQNFPEGLAVSLPLRREGFSRTKAFFFGQLSAIVEPISGVIGALLVLKVRYLLPYLLSFAAGAMIYVVVCELIPESQTNKRKSLITIFTLLGFIIMMIMDIALG